MLFYGVLILSTFVHHASAASHWPMFLNDSRHTGRSPYVIGNQLKLLWESDVSKTRAYDYGIAVAVDGTVYAGSNDHYLYALNPNDGSVIWEFMADHEIIGSPAIDTNGTIYIGTKGGHVYSIDQEGTLNWDYDVKSRVSSSIVISSTNQLFIPTEERIYSLDTAGNSLWKERPPMVLAIDGLPYGSASSPAIGDNGNIYLCAFGSSSVVGGVGLVALSPNGEYLWGADLPEAGFSSPAIADDGTIYCPGGHLAQGGNPKLTAVDPDGTIDWTYELPDMAYNANASIAHDGTIFVGTDDYFLNAINPDGTLKWCYLTTSTMNASSSIIGGNGVVLTVPLHGGQDLFAINPDGTLKWRLSGPDNLGFLQNPVIAHGTLYIGYSNGIRAYDISSLSSSEDMMGTWSFSIKNNWVNPGNANCAADKNDQGQLAITQSGDNVSAKVVGEGILFSGTVDGNHSVTTASFPENGGTTTMVSDVKLSSSFTTATGILTWSWADGSLYCNGGGDITYTKVTDDQSSDSGGGDAGGGGCFITTSVYGPCQPKAVGQTE